MKGLMSYYKATFIVVLLCGLLRLATCIFSDCQFALMKGSRISSITCAFLFSDVCRLRLSTLMGRTKVRVWSVSCLTSSRRNGKSMSHHLRRRKTFWNLLSHGSPWSTTSGDLVNKHLIVLAWLACCKGCVQLKFVMWIGLLQVNLRVDTFQNRALCVDLCPWSVHLMVWWGTAVHKLRPLQWESLAVSSFLFLNEE